MPRTAPTTVVVCTNPECPDLMARAAEELADPLAHVLADVATTSALVELAAESRRLARRRRFFEQYPSQARSMEIAMQERVVADAAEKFLGLSGMRDAAPEPVEAEATMTHPTMDCPSYVVGDPTCPTCGEEMA